MNSLDWDFDFASLCGTALAASVLRCLFFVGQLQSTIFGSDSNLTLLDCSSHLHLDYAICLCVVTRSSPTLLMNCGWVHQLSSASTGPSGPVCVCSCGASFIIATVSSEIGSGICHLHIDDLFVASLWREIRLSFTVFAGVVQRVTRLTFWCTF